MPTATPAPMLTRGHKKKARTRQLLLDTALAVLAERGEGFSVADLIARAGVSHGTFYNYFTDRDQLVQALVPHIVEGFAARSAAEVDDPDPAVRFYASRANAGWACSAAPTAGRRIVNVAPSPTVLAASIVPP